jgi:propanediol dehydratase small subunit
MRFAKLKVIRPFFDMIEKIDRGVGQLFETTKERAEELIKNPNRIVEVYEVITKEESETEEVIKNFADMNYNELKALAKKEGYTGKSMKKNDLIDFLNK